MLHMVSKKEFFRFYHDIREEEYRSLIFLKRRGKIADSAEMIHQNTGDVIEPNLKKIQRLCMLSTQILIKQRYDHFDLEPQAIVSYIESV